MNVADILLPKWWWLLAGASDAALIFLAGLVLLKFWRRYGYLCRGSSVLDWIDLVAMIYTPKIANLPIDPLRRMMKHVLRTHIAVHTNINIDEIICRCLLSSGLSFCLTYLIMRPFGRSAFWLALIVAILIGLAPVLKRHDASAKHLSACQRELAYIIDYLALSMDAGLDFIQSLEAVTKNNPQLSISKEFAGMLRNLQLGMSRDEALRTLEQRIPSRGMSLFCQNMSQALKVGADIVQTLYAMADSQRAQRFSSAEEEAGKISVRMMIPMMVFVMPATCIVLLGPMILQWLKAI